MTTEEWRAALGWSEYATVKALRSLVKSGKMAPGRAARQNMCGITMPVPVYRLKG